MSVLWYVQHQPVAIAQQLAGAFQVTAWGKVVRQHSMCAVWPLNSPSHLGESLMQPSLQPCHQVGA